MEEAKTYMTTIDTVIREGVYKDNWESLSGYPVPEWYQRAKFGIFIHWGISSVPAFGEWYPRFMYQPGSPAYEHHLKTYGPHKEFGYADFIPLFKAEHFDAAEWIKIFKDAGARYVMPVAEHHDGFQMYDSALSRWNAARMGPCRDVLGELKAVAETEGLVFTASSHRAENFWFFNGAREFDSGVSEEYQEPYGYTHPLASPDGDPHSVDATQDIYSTPASKEHLEDWLARCCELVDRYRPKIVWFDWWIQNVSFKPYLKKFAAYYYNRSLEWGHGVAINYKFDAYGYTTAVFDIERGQLSEIRPRLWQCDTAISKKSWGYAEHNEFKSPVDLVCDLVDIVSKNGCLLLNVGPKSDGTITGEEREVLASIGAWLEVNGESIYDTTYWIRYGEGPTEIPDGAFTDTNRRPYTVEDIRFTYKAPYLYANVLRWPDNNTVTVKTLKWAKQATGEHSFRGDIRHVEILGHSNAVTWHRDEAGLHVRVDGRLESDYPVCLRITVD